MPLTDDEIRALRDKAKNLNIWRERSLWSVVFVEVVDRMLAAEALLQWYVDHYGPEAPGLPERFVEGTLNAND